MKFVLFLFILLSCLLFQLKVTADEINVSKSYLLNKPLMVRGLIEIPSLSVQFDPEGDQKETQYEPNQKMNVGAGLVYQDMEFKVVLPVDQSSEENQKKGTTNHFDLRLSKFWSQSGVDLIFGTYQGFYSEGDSTSVYHQRSDLRIRQWDLNYYYVVNPSEYDIQHVRTHRIEGTSSDGSWLLFGSMNYANIESSGGLMEGINNVSGLTTIGAFVGGGYGYTWGSLDHSMGGEILMGFGPQRQNVQRPGGIENRSLIGNKLTANGFYSYQMDGWLLGVSFQLNTVTQKVESFDVKTTSMGTTVFGQTVF